VHRYCLKDFALCRLPLCRDRAVRLARALCTAMLKAEHLPKPGTSPDLQPGIRRELPVSMG